MDGPLLPLAAVALLALTAGAAYRLGRRRPGIDARLAESEARFREMADAAPVAISVARVGIYLYANRAFRDLYGLPPGLDLVGRRVTDDIAPRDRQMIADRIRRRAAGEPVPSVYEFAGRRPDGSEFVATAHVGQIALPDGPASVCFSTDATARRAAEDALRASDERYRAFVANSTEGVWRVEFDPPVDAGLPADEQVEEVYRCGRLAECNDVFARMYGYARAAEVVGRGLDLFLPPDDPDARAYLRAVIAGGYRAAEVESAERDRDGNPVYFSNSLSGVVEGGRLVRAWGTQRDVTARKRAEAALRASEEKYRTLFESMDQGFCVAELVFDPAGDPIDYRILEMNPAFEKHTGLRGVVGRAASEFAPGLDRFWHRTYGRVAVTGEPARFVSQAAALEGRWFDVYAFRLGPAADRRVAILFTDISDRKRAEDAVRQQAADLQTLLDTLPVGVFFAHDPDCRRITANRAGRELMRMPDAANLSKTAPPGEVPTHFRVCRNGAEVPPDDLPVQRAARGEPVTGDEVDQVFADGAVLHTVISAAPLLDPAGRPRGAVAAILDVTARKRAEDARAASEERFRLAADAVNGIIYEFDPRAGTVERTRGLFEVLGYRPDEVPATAAWWWEQIHPDDRPRVAAGPPPAGDGRSRAEYRVRHKDGRWLHVEDRAVVLRDAAGRPVRLVGSTVDVTDRKRAEEALREADRRKDEFLATLAHELRNPLAPIRNGLHIMKLAAADPAAVAATRAVMERQLGQLVRLIDDLLDVARITRGKIDLRPERVDLTALVRQAVDDARPLADQAGHALTVDAPADPVWVDADPTRLAQVVFNLLTNSVKYTRRGGRIGVAVGRRDGAATVTVTDTGVGIPADMLGRVFDMFTQVDRDLEKTTGGLGIGLSLVKALVEMHGGTVAAASPGEGLGSTFTVTLPLAAQAAQAGMPVPPGPDSGGTGIPACAPANGAARPARRKVLVVDDNEDAAESLGLVLELLGSEVRTAHDGQAGVAAALGFRPDLILMDIGMPKLNGYDACRQLRQDPWGRGAFIVALTGWGQDDDRKRARDAGFDRHLVKPIDPGAVRALLAELSAVAPVAPGERGA